MYILFKSYFFSQKGFLCMVVLLTYEYLFLCLSCCYSFNLQPLALVVSRAYTFASLYESLLGVICFSIKPGNTLNQTARKLFNVYSPLMSKEILCLWKLFYFSPFLYFITFIARFFIFNLSAVIDNFFFSFMFDLPLNCCFPCKLLHLQNNVPEHT